MAKLNNLKAVRELINGTHKTQTRTSIGFSDINYQAEKTKKREVGDIWEEINAKGETVCWWEQKDGYRVKYNMHPEVSKKMQEMRDYLNSFPNCQKDVCTCKQPNRIDEKFRRIAGMCEECLITFETKLKVKGEFNEYAINRMKANAEAFFKQADKEVEIIKDAIRNPISYLQNSLGEVEKWNVENPEYLVSQIENQYQDYKNKVNEKFSVE